MLLGLVRRLYLGSRCPQPWYQIGERCIRAFETELQEHEANTACQNLGGDLAHFSSLADYRVITDFAFRWNPTETESKAYWMGARKLANTKKFTWDSLQMDISHWVSKACKTLIQVVTKPYMA